MLELTDAYVPFANGGYRAPVYFITKVTDSEDKVLYQKEDGVGPRVIDERNVGMMNAMLRRTVEDGTAKARRLRLARRRQDRHQPEFPRCMVRRLYRQPHDRRVVRQ